MNLQYFDSLDFYKSLQNLFNDLNIPIVYKTNQRIPLSALLKDQYKQSLDNQLDTLHLNTPTYYVGTVNQSVFEQGNDDTDIETNIREKDYEGLYIFGIDLGNPSKTLSKSLLIELTRCVHRRYKYVPIVVVFKYQHYISLATTERLAYQQKWREGEKIGKVSLLKDINTQDTHAGHQRILFDMTINRLQTNTFKDLYTQWRKVFDLNVLNNKFYKDIFNWYCWALQNVEFPADIEPNKDIRNATNIIRLITRLIFVWFLKEKKLVPETLFDEKKLTQLLDYKDKTQSTYYKAILQNLFFATLNTEMNSAEKPKNRRFVNREYGVHTLYRYQRFFKDEKKALELFQDIPFLNGGLFECLDKNIGTADEIRIDCFSDNSKNETLLSFPDYLFFGETQIDLSQVYDDKRKNKENVQGLLAILKQYKFTIEENTPLDEEVALDPELLGKIFENLLASYNPETQTTARKSTGSFYTPREIVDYMVEESLIAHLSPLLVDKESEPKLRQLLSYTHEENLFEATDTQTLIKAINSIKILDPACGSGAFPMGILQKLVHILSKLDPNNEKWRALQEEKALVELRQAMKIVSEEERKKTIQEIDDVFELNQSDYGRKLYLIENAIYGVDIQAVAVQISKLRFFISLIVSQNTDNQLKNRGIRPLPNLETKFVAANTLIGLNNLHKGQTKLKNLKIEEVEAELKTIRQRYFLARTPETKEKYRQKDQATRQLLAQLITKDGFLSSTDAQKVADWNLYDQNTSATWFDMEWMFGIKEGFDVVIGNPPYVRADSPAIAEQRKLIMASKQYETLWEKWDLMIPFYEKGLKLLASKGVHSFVVSNAITTSKYAELLQQWIIQNFRIRSIDYFENIKTFDAGVIPVITIIQKTSNLEKTKKIIRTDIFENTQVKEIILSESSSNLKRKIFKKEFSDIFNPEIPIERLGDICYLSKGMVTNSDENEAKGEFVKDDLISEIPTKIHTKPYIEGKNLKAYHIEKIRYIEWNTKRVPEGLSRPTFRALYEGSKILRGRVTQGTYDNTGLVCNDSIIVMKRFIDLKGVSERSIDTSIAKNNLDEDSKKKIGASKKTVVKKCRQNLEKTSLDFSLKYILAIINSKYAMAFLNNFRRHRLENYFYPDDFRNYPIPQISPSAQKPFETLVDYILWLKANASPRVFDTTENSALAYEFEKVIDMMVYELYFPKEMQEKEIEVLRFIQFTDIQDFMNNPTQVAEVIAQAYTWLQASNNPVRNRMILADIRSETILQISSTTR